MEFNTIEGQATYVFRALLGNLYLEYLACKNKFGLTGDQTFDQWIYDHLEDLGEIAYEFIGEYFGDCDTAISDLGIDD